MSVLELKIEHTAKPDSVKNSKNVFVFDIAEYDRGASIVNLFPHSLEGDVPSYVGGFISDNNSFAAVWHSGSIRGIDEVSGPDFYRRHIFEADPSTYGQRVTSANVMPDRRDLPFSQYNLLVDLKLQFRRHFIPLDGGLKPHVVQLALHDPELAAQRDVLEYPDTGSHEGKNSDPNSRHCCSVRSFIGGTSMLLLGVALTAVMLQLCYYPLKPSWRGHGAVFALFVAAGWSIIHAVFLILGGSWNPPSF